MRGVMEQWLALPTCNLFAKSEFEHHDRLMLFPSARSFTLMSPSPGYVLVMTYLTVNM